MKVRTKGLRSTGKQTGSLRKWSHMVMTTGEFNNSGSRLMDAYKWMKVGYRRP